MIAAKKDIDQLWTDQPKSCGTMFVEAYSVWRAKGSVPYHDTVSMHLKSNPHSDTVPTPIPPPCTANVGLNAWAHDRARQHPDSCVARLPAPALHVIVFYTSSR